MIVLTVEAEDANASPAFPGQVDRAEATLFVQAYRADAPQFTSPPSWTPSDPVVEVEVPEELPAGSVLFKLAAKDPITGLQVLPTV